jgi:hypothetical protein
MRRESGEHSGHRSEASRSGVSRIFLAGAAFAVLALIPVGEARSATGPTERRIHVQGRVLDPDGGGVPGLPVRLFKTRRSLSVGRFSSGGQVTEASRTVTDGNGYFEIDVPRDRSYDDFMLRYYDSESFDRVKYAIPADREITKDLRGKGPIIVDLRLGYEPRWKEVQERIRRAGDDSPMGEILRKMGIPEREQPGVGPDGPRVEWWYHTRGIVYFFSNGLSAGYRSFEPVVAGVESGGV